MARTAFVVEMDLDQVPGWGHQAEDYVAHVQRYLDQTVSHYNPVVTLDGNASAYLSLRTELATIFGPVTPREGQTWNEAMLAEITEKLVSANV